MFKHVPRKSTISFTKHKIHALEPYYPFIFRENLIPTTPCGDMLWPCCPRGRDANTTTRRGQRDHVTGVPWRSWEDRSLSWTMSWINGLFGLNWLLVSREFLGHFLEDEGYMHGISPRVFQVERCRKNVTTFCRVGPALHFLTVNVWFVGFMQKINHQFSPKHQWRRACGDVWHKRTLGSVSYYTSLFEKIWERSICTLWNLTKNNAKSTW